VGECLYKVQRKQMWMRKANFEHLCVFFLTVQNSKRGSVMTIVVFISVLCIMSLNIFTIAMSELRAGNRSVDRSVGQ